MNFIGCVTKNVLNGFGNIFLNGFASDLTLTHRVNQVGIKLKHFIPINKWSFDNVYIVDQSTNNKYLNDSKNVVRAKCAALFATSFFVQPIGLLLNLLNRVAKIVTFAPLWNSSKEPCSFKGRLTEWSMDVLRVVMTPFLFVGMIFSSAYGAIISPYDGRKLYASLERFAYSGGYAFTNKEHILNNLLAPCFQPSAKYHLGGGNINDQNVW